MRFRLWRIEVDGGHRELLKDKGLLTLNIPKSVEFVVAAFKAGMAKGKP